MRITSAFVALLALAASSGLEDVKLNACEGGKPEFLTAALRPCDSDPCAVTPGSNVVVDFRIQAANHTKNVYVHSHVQENGDNLHTSVVSKNCLAANVPCKVKAGESFEGSVKLYVSKWLRPGELKVTLVVEGDYDHLACGTTRLEVVQQEPEIAVVSLRA